VIATGFRDQMPERRARMLSVEEAPVISVPLVAVPVEAPRSWMAEEKPEAAPPEPPAPPAPPMPRFKSEDENEAAEKGEEFFFNSTTPPVATTVTVAAPPVAIPPVAIPSISIVEEPDTNFERAQTDREEILSVRFVEPIEEAPIAQPPRDFAADFAEPPKVEAVKTPMNTEPVASLFQENSDEEQRDLDVPAFMRRHRF